MNLNIENKEVKARVWESRPGRAKLSVDFPDTPAYQQLVYEALCRLYHVMAECALLAPTVTP